MVQRQTVKVVENVLSLISRVTDANFKSQIVGQATDELFNRGMSHLVCEGDNR